MLSVEHWDHCAKERAAHQNTPQETIISVEEHALGFVGGIALHDVPIDPHAPESARFARQSR